MSDELSPQDIGSGLGILRLVELASGVKNS